MPEEMSTEDLHEELSRLKDDVARYQKEKERVRKVIGNIGGATDKKKGNPKVLNFLFMAVVAIEIIAAFFISSKYSLFIVELAIGFISLKLAHLLHQIRKINHFELWIMSSLEWRFNEMMKEVKKISKKLPKD